MSWDLQYIIDRITSKTASVGPSGIDYSQLTPCSQSPDCAACKHIQAVMSANRDEETGEVLDKDADGIHQMQLTRHNKTIPDMTKEQK